MGLKYLVTVCIPTYNRVRDLRECVESIARQYCEGVQVCICNNASKDETQSYIDSIEYSWVKKLSNVTNLGMARNLNRVLSEADGDYCFILTDDDRLASGKLPVICDLLKQRSPSLMLSHLYSYREGTSVPAHKRHWFTSIRSFSGSVYTAELLGNQTWAWSRLCFRKSEVRFDLLDERVGNGYHLTFALIEILIQKGAVYVDDSFVEHVFDNKVYWEQFGSSKYSIAMKLDFDLAQALSYKCSAEHGNKCYATAVKSFLRRPDGFFSQAKAEGFNTALSNLRRFAESYDDKIKIDKVKVLLRLLISRFLFSAVKIGRSIKYV